MVTVEHCSPRLSPTAHFRRASSCSELPGGVHRPPRGHLALLRRRRLKVLSRGVGVLVAGRPILDQVLAASVRDVSLLAGLCHVEVTLMASLRSNADSNVQELQQDVGDYEGVCGANARTRRLHIELVEGALHCAGVDCSVRQHANQQCARETSHAVHAPDIQGIIQFCLLDCHHAEVANDGSREPDDEGASHSDIACGGRHRGQPGDCTNASPDEAWLFSIRHVHDDPPNEPH
mmetsp:Transcript_88047/g.222238  ORF Transcript_88047/g.222238 Transcript_88047/m.222238 type:complete len:234 (+) Transcript_88047:320-1021(+)